MAELKCYWLRCGTSVVVVDAAEVFFSFPGNDNSEETGAVSFCKSETYISSARQARHAMYSLRTEPF